MGANQAVEEENVCSDRKEVGRGDLAMMREERKEPQGGS